MLARVVGVLSRGQRAMGAAGPARYCSSSVLSPAVATHKVESFAPAPVGTENTWFAVMKINNHQYKVTEGDLVITDKLKVEVGTQMEVEDVLLLGSRDKTIVGRPTIPNAKVVLSVEEHAKDQKVIVFKKKRRQGYKRKQGHRRQLTMLRVDNIVQV